MPKELGRDSSNLNQEKREYLFYMFFGIFEDFSKVKICKLTMPFSLLIFGVFLKNQDLNLQHPYFLTFLKRFAQHFRAIKKIFLS